MKKNTSRAESGRPNREGEVRERSSPWATAQELEGGQLLDPARVGAGPGPDRAQGGGAGPRDLRPHAEEERRSGDRWIPARVRRQAAGMGLTDDGNGWNRPLGTGSDRMWARTARAAQIRAKNGGGRELRRTPCGGVTKHEDLRDTGRERAL